MGSFMSREKNHSTWRPFDNENRREPSSNPSAGDWNRLSARNWSRQGRRAGLEQAPDPGPLRERPRGRVEVHGERVGERLAPPSVAVGGSSGVPKRPGHERRQEAHLGRLLRCLLAPHQVLGIPGKKGLG